MSNFCPHYDRMCCSQGIGWLVCLRVHIREVLSLWLWLFLDFYRSWPFGASRFYLLKGTSYGREDSNPYKLYSLLTHNRYGTKDVLPTTTTLHKSIACVFSCIFHFLLFGWNKLKRYKLFSLTKRYLQHGSNCLTKLSCIVPNWPNN